MWIVRIALDRPLTFIVLSFLILIEGILTIGSAPKDIFPNIGIPVVGVVWSYTGLPPKEIADRLVTTFERASTVTVNDLEHSESQSLSGISVAKLFFQPGASPELAMAQVTAICQTLLRTMPPGTVPPQILIYNASTVPIIQLALSSTQLAEQEIFDLANTVMRSDIATIPGVAMPYPYGGKSPQIQVDIDQKKTQALGLSAQDINNAIGNQNLILPSGTQKIGEFEYNVRLNGSPQSVEELNDLPIKAVNGTVIHLGDVAHARNGFAPQTNVVRMDGARAVLVTLLKTGAASTLDVIDHLRRMLPSTQAKLPTTLDLQPIGDQSVFVRAAIDGVVREGVIAAILTALMILLFLGSWRSTLIIVISIPLSVLVSLCALHALGETINIMTLGGLALAVGILVDDATVAIENINWHLEHGKAVREAILDGAQQIAVPALVSTLCICIVFVPMFQLTGVSRYLFVPLAEAVVFAMLASYFLSRTLVPTLAMWLLQAHASPHEHSQPGHAFARIQLAFERGFERLRDGYHAQLATTLEHRRAFIAAFMAFVILSVGGLWAFLGQDFFPAVDGGQIKLHVRAHSGLRVEEMAKLCDEVDAIVRRVIPAGELQRIVDNIGLPMSGTNLTYSNSGAVGAADADVQISLAEDHHSSFEYIRKLRIELARQLPGVTFAFLPADMVSQILNFGLPAPIDVQIKGYKFDENTKYAAMLYDKLHHIPGITDLRMQQTSDQPELRVNADRTRAQELGITQHDIATNMLVSLSGSFQTSPTFWLNPKNGVSYNIVTQTPQYSLDSLEALRNIPVTGTGMPKPQVLGALATIERGAGPVTVSHYDSQPVIDLYASVQDRDLGGVAADINRVIAETKHELARGSTVTARGQMQTMESSFKGLYQGLAFAVIFIYFLIVVNFQSWTDPFIIITALPGAIAGIVWMLFLTHTTLSVPALTGAIMCMGVATANSILVVSFARERMDHHGDGAVEAALAAGFTRLRPVLMTALAMIIGMVPMALGFGEGGEQNAPLGRAVIGGLIFATVATLFFVPAVFCLIHGRNHVTSSGVPHHG